MKQLRGYAMVASGLVLGAIVMLQVRHEKGGEEIEEEPHVSG